MSSRDKFEAWCKQRNIPTPIWGGMENDDRTIAAWEAWQACESSRPTPHEWIMSRPDGTKMKVTVEDIE